MDEDEYCTSLWAESVQGAEIHRHLCAECGGSADSQTNVYEWTEMSKKSWKKYG